MSEDLLYSRIKLLDPIVIDQIAAGEVVARPASVVKELVENAIDAGASQISIEVVGGGTVSLMISDDGFGLSAQDLPLALTRHATSKLSRISDFNSLVTLGFRGEALASIASVSRLKIVSKSRESSTQIAYAIECEGGACRELKKAARDHGTTIEVADLFYNVPARRKFLKKEITEFGHIADVVEKFIFSFPEIRFSLKHNGRKVYQSPGSGSLIDAICVLWPKDITSTLMELNYLSESVKVTGFVTPPNNTRSAKNLQVFFVNRRCVYNPTLAKALEDAFRNLVENNRHPASVLFLEIDPAQVDVNVHPAKKEVKFADTTLVYTATRNAIANTINFLGVQPESSPSIGSNNATPGFLTEFNRTATSRQAYPAQTDLPDRGAQQSGFIFPQSEINLHQHHSVAPVNLAVRSLSPLQSQSLAVKGTLLQVMDTYILHELDGALVIYDQHALHERVIFEQLLATDQEIASQRLLMPEMVFLSKTELLQLEEHKDIFLQIGFELEFFGTDCILLRGIPTFMRGAEAVTMFAAIMADMLDLKQTRLVEKIRDGIYKIVACRAAIKAGDKLSAREMDNLLQEAERIPNISTCPHGRPTKLIYSRTDLDKLFHRL